MAPDELEVFLENHAVQFALLYRGDSRVGFCESHQAADNDIEITNFGLIPEVQGQKLGPFLLDHALRFLWSSQTQRIWLHTDTNDHPNAIKTYERAGFEIYLRQWQSFPD